MLHDSGIVTIYKVSVDENGPPPKVEKLVKRSTHYFGEMTVGIQRYYEAAKVGQQIDRLIEIWRDPNIKTRDIAQIEDRFYFIRQITPTKDEDGILVTRLSLEEDDSGTWSEKL
jgi:hypothetical protein|nr:MAG TPA: hypothetical protein [Caudoviricetes sp.]